MKINLGRVISLDAGEIEALPERLDLQDFDANAGNLDGANERSTSTGGNQPQTTPYVPFSSTISWQSHEGTIAFRANQGITAPNGDASVRNRHKARQPADRPIQTRRAPTEPNDTEVKTTGTAIRNITSPNGSARKRRKREVRQSSNSRMEFQPGPVEPNHSNAMMTCPKCGKTMPEHELPDHFQAKHQRPVREESRPAQPLRVDQQSSSTRPSNVPRDDAPPLDAVCPICGARLRASRLDKHMRKCHSTRSDVATCTPKAPTSASLISVISDEIESAFLEGDIETITDEFYDEMYDDKYVGQSWPESSGQYGSIPLYDDYSDEAGA